MTQEQILIAAREELMRETPLRSDCGRLCGGACCQGDDDEGMLLFPGEDLLCKKTHGDFHIRALDYAIGLTQAQLITCQGSCERDERPLACRLFPLLCRFRGERAVLVLDPRARMTCPLCDYGLSGLSSDFIAAAQRAIDLLMQDEACKAHLHGLDDMLSL